MSDRKESFECIKPTISVPYNSQFISSCFDFYGGRKSSKPEEFKVKQTSIISVLLTWNKTKFPLLSVSVIRMKQVPQVKKVLIPPKYLDGNHSLTIQCKTCFGNLKMFIDLQHIIVINIYQNCLDTVTLWLVVIISSRARCFWKWISTPPP